jgi:hypothetical protein
MLQAICIEMESLSAQASLRLRVRMLRQSRRHYFANRSKRLASLFASRTGGSGEAVSKLREYPSFAVGRSAGVSPAEQNKYSIDSLMPARRRRSGQACPQSFFQLPQCFETASRAGGPPNGLGATPALPASFEKYEHILLYLDVKSRPESSLWSKVKVGHKSHSIYGPVRTPAGVVLMLEI